MFQGLWQQAVQRDGKGAFGDGQGSKAAAGDARAAVTFSRRAAWLLMAAPVLLAGCGNQYRPVVAAINPVGPAIQPTKYAMALSSPSATQASILTIVDFSGDSILSTINMSVNPTTPLSFALTSAGTEAFTINTTSANLNDLNVGVPSTLLNSDVVSTLLPAGSAPTAIFPLQLGSQAQRLFIPQPGLNAGSVGQIAVTSVGSPALIQEIPVQANPLYVVGVAGATRGYALSAPTTTDAGYAQAIEGNTLSVSTALRTGINPTFGIMTADGRRAFVLNKGSGNVNVINAVTNAYDVAAPLIPATGTLGTAPVWADIAATTSELVVLNQGDGTHAGSLSIISIPLCSATAQPGTSACDATNPVDATGFGTVIATVPVGVNPSQVSILQDGTRAYVCNQGNAAAGIEGSVSVVNLTTNTVTATIPAISTATATATESSSPTYVYGHPNTITAITGTPTGKVYVTSSDNKFMTVIETDTDSVDTHLNLQGLGVRVIRSLQ